MAFFKKKKIENQRKEAEKIIKDYFTDNLLVIVETKKLPIISHEEKQAEMELLTEALKTAAEKSIESGHGVKRKELIELCRIAAKAITGDHFALAPLPIEPLQRRKNLEYVAERIKEYPDKEVSVITAKVRAELIIKNKVAFRAISVNNLVDNIITTKDRIHFKKFDKQ